MEHLLEFDSEQVLCLANSTRADQRHLALAIRALLEVGIVEMVDFSLGRGNAVVLAVQQAEALLCGFESCDGLEGWHAEHNKIEVRLTRRGYEIGAK
ncbi:MAG: hypothetical protein MUC36_08370 [Planctomycetes bacterium]|nr:hypothetical protein [Planctomycetota bacterium]